MKSILYKVVWMLSMVLVPLLLVVFAVIYQVDRRLYTQLIKYEWSTAQWLTAVFLALSALGSFRLALKVRQGPHRARWFFIAFSAFCLLSALEEINWGQDLLGMQTPEFFMEHSDQHEINAHNIFQKWAGLKTKHISGLALFLYGTCLPLLARQRGIGAVLAKIYLIVPPPVLALSFFSGALMMLDRPTGDEEELGEFFFSLSFFLFIVLESFAVDLPALTGRPSAAAGNDLTRA